MSAPTLTELPEIVVTNGANSQNITPVEGDRFIVGELRSRLGDVLNIAPNAIALIGTEEVEEDRVVVPGEQLQFIKRSGTKG